MIGIDIVSVKRIDTILNSARRQKFLDKIFSQKEQKYLKITKSIKSQSIAGYFASKEAIAKALKCGIGSELSFLDIELSKDAKNAPHFSLLNKAKDNFTFTNSSISISHDGGFAISVAVIF